MKFNKAVSPSRLVGQAIATKLLIKGTVITMSGLFLLLSGTYVFSFFYEKYGSFTVRLDKYDMLRIGVSLSETPDFKLPTSRLNADAIKSLDNITKADLPENLDKTDGKHNGRNYIAYTFYIKNTGKSSVSYSSSLNISSVSKNVDAAVRIMLYDESVAVTYAKPKDDLTGPEPETEPFYSQTVVAKKYKANFKPGDIHKYTVVIWLEGNDPDCVDSILGGSMNLEMAFSVVEYTENGNSKIGNS